MIIKIYQIDFDRDVNGVIYEGYRGAVDARIYNLVYEGNVRSTNLEDVYRIFNVDVPEDYCGRCLSVSDVVEVVGDGYYYCDNIGFKPIKFDADKVVKKELRISVLMCEPNKEAYITSIANDLTVMQKIVGGYIEAASTLAMDVVIVCNEEGKLNGSAPCRAIIDDESGEILDIIFGTFFICGVNGEELASLSEKQMRDCIKKFGRPERFFKNINGDYEVSKI